MAKSLWPAWFNSPDGETKIFNSPDEVPKGWTGGAEKRSAVPIEPEATEKPKRGRLGIKPAEDLDL